MSERGLGRGLGALIPRARQTGLKDIPVDSVLPNPMQPRGRRDASELEQLAESIRLHGLLQPILVSELDGGSYRLLTGERRWRAARMAGLTSVPALVKESTPRSSLEMALVENIQRLDLNPMEEATAYRLLMHDHGLTQEQLAHRVGRHRVSIANTMRLLSASAAVQRAIVDGEISEGHARAIMIVEGETAQIGLLADVIAQGMSVRETEARARRLAAVDMSGAADEPEPIRDPDLDRLEDAFRHALGTRVRLLRGRRGGRLVIHFYSNDELQGLYEALVRQ